MAVLIILIFYYQKEDDVEIPVGVPQSQLRLHWFIPDGMRADPTLFKVFRWADEGKLPNIKRLMDTGSYGYSIPTFPSHTPTNFATLLTGAYPTVHGVADGPMHIEGYPLAKPSVAGFSSAARKIPAIWTYMEESGRDVVLLSMPGSTPPELKRNGITIRGRWGGWGADFHSLIFETRTEEQRKKLARGSRLFFLGYELTRFILPVNETVLLSDSFSEPINLEFDCYGAIIYASIIDTTDDMIVNYDQIIFSRDGITVDAELMKGEWSEWLPVIFSWKEKNISSDIKINVIKLEEDGFFRIRFVVNNLNRYIVEPGSVSDDLVEDVGPMVDFVDNFPPQLIYYDEDKTTFLEEMNMSFDWHKNAVKSIKRRYDPDVFIHDIYSPNQMLTSRWWLGYIDNESMRYDNVTEEERAVLWEEVFQMYTQLDEIIGEILETADENTVIVLSSDHGAAPLNKWIRINNLFAQKGWINYTLDPETGEPLIDWETSKVVYLKMDNVYINPRGLGGDWVRASGEEYEELREEVKVTLEELRHESGPDTQLIHVIKWEDVEEFLDLPKDRVGDLVVANFPGFGINEEITADGEIFDEEPLKTGYKQRIFSKDTPAMWTPFIISGPGIKKDYMLDSPIEMVDQFPTIMKAMNQEIPNHVQGRILVEIFEE